MCTHLFESDVFTLTELDQVLDAVNDPQPAELVNHAHVARVQPAFLVDQLTRLGLVFVVAGDDVLALHANLAARVRLVGREVTHLGNVDELHLDAGERGADRASRPQVAVVATVGAARGF